MMAPVSSVPVFIYSSLNWHCWMWWLKPYWFGKTFDFHMHLLVCSSQSYQLTSRVLFTPSSIGGFQHGLRGDFYQKWNIFCFLCQWYAWNLVPAAVVVSLCCPSRQPVHSLVVFVCSLRSSREAGGAELLPCARWGPLAKDHHRSSWGVLVCTWGSHWSMWSQQQRVK